MVRAGVLKLDLEPRWDFDRRPTELVRVDTYRAAARAVVEADLPATGPDGYLATLAKLGVEVRKEPAPIQGMASRAMWEEVGHLYGEDPEEDWSHAPPTSTTDPLLRLRRQGHDNCPTCVRPLPSFTMFSYWSDLDLAEAKRRDRRKAALGG